MHALVHPWSETFMQLALLELVFLGVVGGIVGCWILFYELAYSAESLAHALFPGLVVAALVGLPVLAGGAVGVAVAAVGIALVRRVPSLGADVSVAVVITTLFGLGVLLALRPATPPGLDGLLFGDLLGVTRGDVIASGVLTAVAGVAKPEAFFAMLRREGLQLAAAIALPDHHDFNRDPAAAAELVCTEKDAVKLWRLRPDAWAVPLELEIEPGFWLILDRLLDAKLSSAHGSQTS